MRATVITTAKLLGLMLTVAVAILLFNYLRYVVIWAPTERVTFDSDGVTLAGTLIKPAREGVFPAVIVLHGSGRDVTSDPLYRATANSLVRNGFAVLLYDKRGVGDSGGDFDAALYRDFIADAVAAVRYLAGRADIDAAHIGLHGNSESGWFTPEIALRTGKVAFIFNRVSPPLSWIDNVAWEVRNDLLAAGVAAADADTLVEFAKRRWRYYIAAGNNPALATGEEREAIEARLRELRRSIPAAADELPESLPPYDETEYAGYAANFSYDPQSFLEAIDIPMIYVFGADDINIPTRDSVRFLESFREAHGKHIDIVVFEGVGHPLASWKGLFTAGFLPEYFTVLNEWCSARI